ncbi:glycosyltransferase [Novosphingobium sp. BW1]|uniref:glycosyltransferase n=1 Tax=Novosphingobium sp. BW1 TaxID=2592621 RepID=UPI0011DEC19C|nr:glycosyltransferase [Novosphingobium sp. BW1]TYC93270.1 glycosyltransferase [Novosphingobium sp. BW1]
MKLKGFRSRRFGPGARSNPGIAAEHIALCLPYFDLEFYRNASGNDEHNMHEALAHYLLAGWREGLDPSEAFSTLGYLGLYPDVAEAQMNPLLHYVLHGVHENRRTQAYAEGYDGWIELLSGSHISGWAANKARRGEVLTLRLLIDGEFFAEMRTEGRRPDLDKQGHTAGQGGFALDLPLYLMNPGPVEVAVAFPDGTRIEGQITIAEPAGERIGRSPSVFAEATPGHVKVVVPIYNALEDVRTCIARLRAFTPDQVEVLLIDDCSPDPAIGELLATLADEPRFQVLRNAQNLGFTRTVNRGLEETGRADVIILNSDARVTPGWIEGMYAAATSRDQVATVTAMSDRAGAFSAPNIGNDNPLPPGIDEATFARAFRRRSLRVYPEVPTGNGFCMYIRRAAVDALGPLDAEAFPRGYGEENDFCMRAMRAGWFNLIDDATYVFHDRSKSFGEEKNVNMAAGRQVVDARYPEYKALIGTFTTSGAIAMARHRARLALRDCTGAQGVLPRALFVLSTRTGGTPQTNADLMGALEETFECFVLRCDSRELELSHYREGTTTSLRKHRLAQPIEPVTHRSSEYDMIVAQWIATLDLDVIHIRHLGWHSLNLPRIAKRSGARVVYSLHDFYTLCPSLKLLDESNTFCGGTCTAGTGACKVELWQDPAIPPLKNAWVHHWRARMAEAIAHCDAFVTTSPSARDRVLNAMPSIPAEHFHVIPHGRDFNRFENLQHLPSGDSPVRILVPGNIDKAKGLDLIAGLLELDKLGHFEFHILGGVHLSALQGPKPARMHLHGRYDRADFADKVRRIAPHFGAVFSVWDETYCHTLTEMWSVGLPVVVLDFPTLRRRMEDCGAGWVLEDMTSEGVYARLSAIAADREELMAKGLAATRWQERRGTGQSCRQMASRYLDVYRGAPVGAEIPKVATVCPGSPRLRDAFPSTEIRVWERTRNALDRPVDYVRSTPAGLIAKMRLRTVSGAIIQRTAMPAALVDRFLVAASETQTPFLFELDDDLMAVPADKDTKGFYAAYRPYLEKLLRSAQGVIVSTPALADAVRPFNAAVHIVENRVSGRLWSALPAPRQRFEPRLLYMGGPSHHEDLEFALEAIALARGKIPNLRLTLVGGTSAADLPEWVDTLAVEARERSYRHFVPWLCSQIAGEVLGIAPLLDTAFNRFKSDLKVLDYGALGLPVLASKVQSYATFEGAGAQPGVTLLANRAQAWADEIVRRLNRPEDLRRDGAALREWTFANRRVEDDLARYDRLVLDSLAQAALPAG